MKNLLLFALLLPACLCAQKVKLEDDTIYKDAVPYAMITKESHGMEYIYSVRTLRYTEVAIVKFDDAAPKSETGLSYYRVTFTGSGNVGHFPSSLQLAKRLAEAVVANNLVNDSTINPEGEKRFLMLYPNRISQQPNITINVGTGPNYTTVDRNRNMPVFENAGEITQAGENIGRCTSTTQMNGGKSTAFIQYYLPNGTLCAEAKCDLYGASTATITTMKDNRTHTFNVTNASIKEKQIAEFLVQNNYM